MRKCGAGGGFLRDVAPLYEPWGEHLISLCVRASIRKMKNRRERKVGIIRKNKQG